MELVNRAFGGADLLPLTYRFGCGCNLVATLTENLRIFREDILPLVYDALCRIMDVRQLLRQSQTGEPAACGYHYSGAYTAGGRIVPGDGDL